MATRDAKGDPIDPGNGTDPLPAIILTFAGPDRAEVTAKLAGVTPAQLYGAAWYLDQLAREVRMGQLQAAALGAMAPGGQDNLDRIVQDIMRGRHS